ncbi:unnamed protein product [Soboliphyme baturini]|uniref:G_PROTEIN_RECEP_F1_2 domain-containing protein n=1 Tax=Soboliphyme baturini TaxID=241478 RepID=A0A183J4C7_9BILA|nr:unnamed protein product [Soboliphyme baturini]
MENVTNVEYYRLGQLNLSKYTLYLSLSFVSITVSVMAFVAICMFSKHTKHHILFEGFNFACAINSFAAIYQCFYSIHVQMIGVQQVSRRACALSALFNPLQIFKLFSAHRLKFDLLVTKRLALAAGNLAALMILPIILHFLLTASKSALQFMWLIWFPYDSSLVVAILLYCWYQKLLQQLVARFVHYVRSSKVSPGGCSQDMRSASNDHTHTRV